jgi:23S rRNA (cytosine1962-C5)-methyltransferase
MMQLELYTPQHFKDYELIDCGNFLKLERFGNVITIRPEPQALWDPALNIAEWRRQAHVEFVPKSSSSGEWKKLKPTKEQWRIQYQNKEMETPIALRLGLTSFKHVGVFPEQAVNWDYIHQSIKKVKKPEPKFLNLFAYTGAASVVARNAGADVVHCDSIKQVVSWANENMLLSNLKDIHWVVEDALKFVKREVKRGKKYNGIILDPPAYGHGANGEKWKLEENINEMMQLVLQLLDEEEHFLILNAYSLGMSALAIKNLVQPFVDSRKKSTLKLGELYLESTTKKILPLGVWSRLSNL